MLWSLFWGLYTGNTEGLRHRCSSVHSQGRRLRPMSGYFWGHLKYLILKTTPNAYRCFQSQGFVLTINGNKVLWFFSNCDSAFCTIHISSTNVSYFSLYLPLWLDLIAKFASTSSACSIKCMTFYTFSDTLFCELLNLLIWLSARKQITILPKSQKSITEIWGCHLNNLSFIFDLPDSSSDWTIRALDVAL